MATSATDRALASASLPTREQRGSPRTPHLSRNISSQFGSPGASLRSEQDDSVVYELGARHLTAGFAGEDRPRCVLPFTPAGGRKADDYRTLDPEYKGNLKELSRREGYELYTSDVRGLDLGLVEDKLERAIRTVHNEHLLLDQKPKRAILAVQSQLPTPLLDIVLKILFNHHTQPPSVMIMTAPLLACVGAGVRNAIVVDVGWEETVVTAIGEYKEIGQRRSVRAGSAVVREVSSMLQTECGGEGESEETAVPFAFAEEVMQRMVWCRPLSQQTPSDNSKVSLPDLTSSARRSVDILFHHFSNPIQAALFPSPSPSEHDDHDLPIPTLLHRLLLTLPLDLRALCVSRIIITGGTSQIPGLKHRILKELQHILDTQGWDPIHSYGSATAHHAQTLQERSATITRDREAPPADDIPLAPTKKPIQESIAHGARIHDDKFDPVTLKAERESREKAQATKGVVRGAETMGAWAGASLVASLKVRGAWEVEREEFLKHGLRDEGVGKGVL